MWKWQQIHGDDATYNNLISVFRCSCRKDLVDFIKKLEPEIEQKNNSESGDDTCPQPLSDPSQPVDSQVHQDFAICFHKKGNLTDCMTYSDCTHDCIYAGVYCTCLYPGDTLTPTYTVQFCCMKQVIQ